jgi:serine/threonine protein phosphatase PrpC
MPRPEQHESACPACAEPLEPEDLFCGVCGTAARPVRANGPDESKDESKADGPVTTPAAEHQGDLRQDRGEQRGEDCEEDHGKQPREDRGEEPGQDPRETLRDSSGTKQPAAAAATPTAEQTPDRPACVACGLGDVGTDGHCEHCGHAQPRPRDHQELELEGAAAVSDRGLRHHRNEDAFAVSAMSLPDSTPAVVAVVCDGVSSAYRPDDASAAAAETVNESLLDALEQGAAPEEAMRKALVSGAQAVTDLACEDHPDPDRVPHRNAPACTCVIVVTVRDVFTVGWVGDSRAYWIPDDRARPPARLTEDDSWAARMVAAGIMSEEEAYSDARAHAITGWLGADAVELEPHTASFQPDEPGVVVVCTDGLWNYAESSAELASVVPSDARHRPLRAARALVGVALDCGGHDNITVAVLPFPTTVGTAVAGEG